MNSVDKLKMHLTDVWNIMQQNVVDAVINEWSESNWDHACMKMENILNICCEYVWLTKVTDK